MASLIGVAMRRAGEGRLDVPVAAMMGFAAGALVFMMPISILEGAALASGLADVFPPAYPPLGTTAQAMSGIVAALIGFGIAFAVMRLVDRAPGMFDPKERMPGDEEDEPAPRMRRRDLHPDAPVRRPLSAMRDLGEPFERTPEPATEAPRRRKPLAAMLDPQEEAMPHMPWERAPSPVPEAEVPQKKRVRMPMSEQPGAAEQRPEEPALESAPELPVPAEPVEQRSEEPVCEEPMVAPAPLGLADDTHSEVAGFDWEERPAGGAQPPAPAAEAEAPEPAPAVTPPVEAPRALATGEETIGELLARFERALDRRQQPAARRQVVEVPAPAPETADPLDNRLRSALDNLRRFAPQRG